MSSVTSAYTLIGTFFTGIRMWKNTQYIPLKLFDFPFSQLRDIPLLVCRHSKNYISWKLFLSYHHGEVNCCYVVIQGTLWQMRQKVPISPGLICHSPIVNMMLNIDPFHLLSKHIRTCKEDTKLYWTLPFWVPTHAMFPYNA